MIADKPKLKADERFCEKCKRVVKAKKFNHFYEICKECVASGENGLGR